MTTKGFSEKARELGVTRQAVHQAAKVAAGKCSDCGKKATKGNARCKSCRAARAAAARQRRKDKKKG